MTHKLLRGVLASVNKGNLIDTVVFQYNPDTVKRTLRPQSATQAQTGAPAESQGQSMQSSEAPSYIDAPSQTLSFTAYFDAMADETFKDKGQLAKMKKFGIGAQLALLEKLAYPNTSAVEKRERKRDTSKMPLRLWSPRTVLIWGNNRVLPVRITSLDITEDVFDPLLNPVRATVAITLEVQTYANRQPEDEDYARFGAYHKALEQLAKQAVGPSRTDRQQLQKYLAR